MIRVTIEMVPGGIEAVKRHMATIDIRNDVEESLATRMKRGRYITRFSRISQHGEHLGWYDREVKTASISRRQSGAAYRILHQALGEFLKN